MQRIKIKKKNESGRRQGKGNKQRRRKKNTHKFISGMVEKGGDSHFLHTVRTILLSHTNVLPIKGCNSYPPPLKKKKDKL